MASRSTYDVTIKFTNTCDRKSITCAVDAMNVLDVFCSFYAVISC